uniref:Uncharacterized protein n=1 Tax=Rhizophora mucronata TaxID=61149 RepID=A0A2P2JJD3_RHIMU
MNAFHLTRKYGDTRECYFPQITATKKIDTSHLTSYVFVLEQEKSIETLVMTKFIMIGHTVNRKIPSQLFSVDYDLAAISTYSFPSCAM